ncbi:MAG: DUF1016 N-terminal domain-containing protein [Bacteroidales bacterium]|nr:DUF1016 N-terminal domain-containing protein [Bacteroidales bacterium]
MTQLSYDLRSEFPDMKGFSRTNLYYIKQFYEYFSELIVPQSGGDNAIEIVPDNLKSSLPTIEELEQGLKFGENE